MIGIWLVEGVMQFGELPAQSTSQSLRPYQSSVCVRRRAGNMCNMATATATATHVVSNFHSTLVSIGSAFPLAALEALERLPLFSWCTYAINKYDSKWEQEWESAWASERGFAFSRHLYPVALLLTFPISCNCRCRNRLLRLSYQCQPVDFLGLWETKPNEMNWTERHLAQTGCCCITFKLQLCEERQFQKFRKKKNKTSSRLSRYVNCMILCTSYNHLKDFIQFSFLSILFLKKSWSDVINVSNELICNNW